MNVRVTTSLPCGIAVDAGHVAQCDNLTKIESESEKSTWTSHVGVREDHRQSGVTTSFVLRGLPQLDSRSHQIDQFHCTIRLCNS